MSAEELHALARDRAARLTNPDRKQLRFNDIVSCALRFYPADPAAGVRELVDACDRDQAEMYVAKSPMWRDLGDRYSWMLA
jgi:hypothetical protein